MRTLIAALPVLVALHNLEEYLGFVEFARRHGIPLSRRQIQIALGAATLLPLASTILALRSPRQSRMMRWNLTLPAIFAVNATAHAGQCLFFRDYAPGVLMAVAFNLPYAAYLYQRAIAEGYLTLAQRRTAWRWSAVLMLLGVLLLQGLGWLLARLFPEPHVEER
jgi:hypothetical protein